MLRSIKVSLWAVAALVAGCGGGGGSAGTPAPPPSSSTYDLNAAWRNLLTGTNNWAVTGTASNNRSYGITLSTARPQATDIFPITGTSYNASDVTAILSISGLGISTSTSRNYYNDVYQLIGTRNTVDNDPATCSVATTTATPPTAVTVGTSGALQSFTDYTACTPGSPTEGTSVTTWSLETDGSLTLFCLNTTVRNNSNAVLTTEGDCIEVAQSGALGTHARIMLTETSSGLTLLAKNY